MEPLIAKPTDIDLGALFPLLLLAGMFLWNFLLEIFRNPRSSSSAGLWTVALATLGVVYLVLGADQSPVAVLHKMWVSDGLTRVTSVIIFGCLALVSLVLPRDIRESGHVGEYFALLVAAALGMVLLCGAQSLILTFLAVELFSLSLYLLCIFRPDKEACQESGLKYFILSSLASAIMLYAIALIYGATGSTWFGEIGARVEGGGVLLMVGSVLFAGALAFKVSAVPFHLWTPDVYQGAPTSVTAFMSVATKTAALAVLFRFYPLTLGLVSNLGDTQRILWWVVIWSLAILSMLLGNLMALAQTDLKRLLAYSGIAQAGYLLSAVFAGSPQAQSALLYYLLVYLFMNVGAFLVVAALEEVGEELSLSSLAGLSARQPGLAAALALFLFSLTGLPPTAGFFAKFALFGALLDAPGGLLPRYLVAAGLLGSLLSAGYYLKTVAYLYSSGVTRAPRGSLGAGFWLALGLCVLGVLGLALGANEVMGWIQKASFGA